MSEQFLMGRTAVVTGGAKGIGRAVAKRLAESGATVIIADIDLDRASAAAGDIASSGGKCLARYCDVASREQVFALFDDIRAKFGAVEVLINNAGIYRSNLLINVSEEEWGQILGVNLSGAFWCCQAFSSGIRGAGHARIINIASIGGKIGWLKNHGYCASKAGLIGLTRVLALELAKNGVTVNSICPGNTDTDMMTAVDADICAENNWVQGEFRRQTIEKIPMGRIALPDDIANLVIFLCQPSSSFITGQAINVDGGLVMS